jgi:hypothetical protein
MTFATSMMKAPDLGSKLLCFIAFFVIAFDRPAEALPPTGRTRTGVIETVNTESRQFRFATPDSSAPRELTWNKRTRFVQGGRFVEPIALRARTRAQVVYHVPFFGPPFVTKVILLGTAASGSK